MPGTRDGPKVHICMALAETPDFRHWVARFEARHAELPRPREDGSCDGCGGPLDRRPTALPYCLVCLAEQYGRERAEAAASVATALRLALATAEEPPAPDDVRAAVQVAIDEYETALAATAG